MQFGSTRAWDCDCEKLWWRHNIEAYPQPIARCVLASSKASLPSPILLISPLFHFQLAKPYRDIHNNIFFLLEPAQVSGEEVCLTSLTALHTDQWSISTYIVLQQSMHSRSPHPSPGSAIGIFAVLLDRLNMAKRTHETEECFHEILNSLFLSSEKNQNNEQMGFIQRTDLLEVSRMQSISGAVRSGRLKTYQNGASLTGPCTPTEILFKQWP